MPSAIFAGLGVSSDPIPTILSISPNVGSANGGLAVAISGTNFLPGATVTFGGISAPAVAVPNGSAILTTVPPHAAGVVDVVVTNPGPFVGTAVGGFTYTAPPPGLELLVSAVGKTTSILMDMSIRGSMALGARGTLNLSIYDPVSDETAYRPDLDNAIVLSHAVRGLLWAGDVQAVDDQTLGEPNIGTISKINVSDFAAITDRLRLTKTYTSQVFLRDVLNDLVAIMAPYGVTLYSGQPIGPLLEPPSYDDATLTAILNSLSSITKWPWILDFNKVIRMFQIGDIVGPILDPDNTRTMRWNKTRSQYFNYLTVKYGGTGEVSKDEIFHGDGATNPLVLQLTSPMVGWPVVYLDQGGGLGYVHVAPFEPNSLFRYTYDVATNTVHVLSEAPPGTPWPPISATDTILVRYTTKGPFKTVVKNDSEIAARGLWQGELDAGDVDEITAIAKGNTAIARAILRPRKVTLTTDLGPFTPGTVFTLNYPKRLAVGAYLLTEAEFFDESDGELLWNLTLLEGSEHQETWIDFIRDWVGDNTSTSSGGTISGPGTGVAAPKPTYFLGGSAIEFVQSPTPDWVPSSAVQVSINTVQRGTTDAIVFARLRAVNPDISIQARLQNVTDNVTVGVSNVITSQTWINTIFVVSLTTGTKTYELQVLPGAANEDVAAVGYLE